MKQGTVRAWIKASRVKFFIATLIPLAIGGKIAWQAGDWDAGMWLVVLLASFLVHLNTNLANDYFEYFTGADEGESIGGSRVLQEGLITLTQMRNALILFYFIALVCGLYILWSSRIWWFIVIMLFSFFSSVFYTAPPVRYGYHGLGELLVGLNMGPVMTAGTAAALMGHFSLRAFYISIPVAVLVAMILYYQSFSDIHEDRAVGKNTVAVRLGRSGLIHGYRIFILLAVFSILALVVTGCIHPIGWLSLLTVLLPLKLDKLIRSAPDIHTLHDKGRPVRLFYLINGIILLIAV